jgi:hypothetical protein
MKINGEKVPEREGHETIIRVCQECDERKNCEADNRVKGWCHTYEKK